MMPYFHITEKKQVSLTAKKTYRKKRVWNYMLILDKHLNKINQLINIRHF